MIHRLIPALPLCLSHTMSALGKRVLPAALLVLSSSACALAQTNAPACPEPPATMLPNEVAGVEVPAGQIDAAVAKVDQLAKELMASSGIPGMAVAVVHNGHTVFAKGYGVRNIDSGAPVDADTVFQLASLSKALGATVVAHQVGEHAVEWNTPVQKLMPGFKLADPYVSSHVTIADLYAHRSGLPEHAGDLLEDLGYNRDVVLSRLRYLPLASFRDTYAYTNFGLTAAAEAVAIASGHDWATLSQQAIYAPLGMHSTSSRYADFIAHADHAVGHVRSGGAFHVSVPGRQPDAQSPAGGASSSVADMARWMNMVLGEGSVNGHVIVERCALLATVSPQMVSGAPLRPQARTSHYGLGFNVSDSAAGRVVLSHSGAFSLGAGTAFTLIPSLDIGIVTLTNAEPIGIPETLDAEFADYVQFGKLTQDWKTLYRQRFAGLLAPTGSLFGKAPPAHPARARPLNRYSGIYDNPYYGGARIDVLNGRLTLTLGPGAGTVHLPLRHWDGDVFVFMPAGENAPDGSISKLTIGDHDLDIEDLDGEYPGKFDKREAPEPRR